MTTVPGLFERQAALTPERIAAVCGQQSLTYRELNARATRVAQRLRSQGLGRGQLVALALERSLEALIAIIGVLKAGAAYLPLAAHHPRLRLAYMLENAAPSLILIDRTLADELPSHSAPRLLIEDAEQGADVDLQVDLEPTDLAYVMYTSGSTGQPKGVEVEHASVASLLQCMRCEPGLQPSDVLVAVTPITFDMSVPELLLPLTVGARTVIASRAQARDGRELLELLRRSEATVLQATPVTFRLLLEAGWSPGDTPRLRAWCGGEHFSRELADAIRERSAELWNCYGPTEATVYCSVLRLEAGPGPVVLGPAMPCATFQVLDEALQPAQTGELYVGGACLARGYLGQSELTRERFPEGPAGRRYRTGDRVRCLAEGRLEFLGRTDHQVKLRGFRIELGEIEASLLEHPDVSACVVVLRQRGEEPILCAYVVARTADPQGLQDFLRARLPGYMLPSTYQFLDALPTSAHGKVDRTALPDPLTPVEEQVARIWAELLSVARVGRQDNFFELGGDSLLAAQAVAWMNATCQTEVDLGTLFAKPRLGELASHLEGLRSPGSWLPLQPCAREPGRWLPRSFAQERWYFLDRLEPGNAAHHIQRAWSLQGKLDLAALERALTGLVERHEALRTTFGEAGQLVGSPFTLRPQQVDLSDRPGEVDDELLRVSRLPYTLSSGPVLRCVVFRLSPDEWVLFLGIHHIAADRWSVGLLVEQLGLLYGARELPPLPLQYADYALWQRRWLGPERMRDQLAYWRERLAGAPRLELSADGPRGLESGRQRLVLSGELTQSLRNLSQQAHATLFMTLAAAFKVVLSRWAGQTDLSLGFPVAQRHRPELEPVVGCLLNLLVLRTDLGGAPTFQEYLSQVRERTLEALAHQDLPFEKLVEQLVTVREPSRHPLFSVMLVMYNTPRSALRLEGLSVEPRTLPGAIGDLDLLLTVEEEPPGLVFTLDYAAKFAPETIAKLMGGLQTLLTAVSAQQQMSLPAPTPAGGPRPGRAQAPPRTRRGEHDGLEKIILDIWKRELGLTSIAPTEGFFELGGHSLLALRVVIALEKALGRSIPLSVLFEAQTAEQLAAALRDPARLSACLVPLQPQGSRPRLYCVHPNRGTVEIYRALAGYLPASQPVFGFEMLREADGKLRHRSVGEMARHYVSELRAFDPQGPYHLCGVSLGGEIACEMARLLRESGQSMGVLALLDTWGPGYPRALPLTDLLGWSGPERLAYLKKRLHNLGQRAREQLMRAYSGLPLPLPRDWEGVGARPFLDRSEPLRPYPGRIHLLRAQEQPSGCFFEPDLGWRSLAGEGLTILEVPGYHERILHEPHVRAVAQALTQVLDRHR